MKKRRFLVAYKNVRCRNHGFRPSFRGIGLSKPLLLLPVLSGVYNTSEILIYKAIKID